MSVLARPDQAVPFQVGDGGQQLVVAPVPAAQTQFLLESTETRLEKCGDFVDGHTGAVPTRCAIAGRRVNITDLLERAREASDFFKALAHESRLVILCLLGGGEKSVMEIADLLGQRQPFVSQRLARPKGDDMVKARRDGKHIYYSLAPDEVQEVILALHAGFCQPTRRCDRSDKRSRISERRGAKSLPVRRPRSRANGS